MIGLERHPNRASVCKNAFEHGTTVFSDVYVKLRVPLRVAEPTVRGLLAPKHGPARRQVRAVHVVKDVGIKAEETALTMVLRQREGTLGNVLRADRQHVVLFRRADHERPVLRRAEIETLRHIREALIWGR